MRLKLQTSNQIIPMNQLQVGEFGEILEDRGSEPVGAIVFAWGKDGERGFQVVGSPTRNNYFVHCEALVRKLKAGDVLVLGD